LRQVVEALEESLAQLRFNLLHIHLAAEVLQTCKQRQKGDESAPEMTSFACARASVCSRRPDFYWILLHSREHEPARQASQHCET
jgi:hypothetical protein